MKFSKALMIAALAAGSLFAAGFTAEAQVTTNNPPPAGPPPGGPGARPRVNFDRIATQLALTDDQKTKAKPIFEDMIQQQIDVRNDGAMDPTAKRAKMREIRETSNAKLKEILTPEQYGKWMRMGPGGRRPAPPGAQAGPGNPPPAAPPTAKPPQ